MIILKEIYNLHVPTLKTKHEIRQKYKQRVKLSAGISACTISHSMQLHMNVSRIDMTSFVQAFESTDLLLELTGGAILHEVSVPQEDKIKQLGREIVTLHCKLIAIELAR